MAKTKKQESNKELEQLLVRVTITNTSNKENPDFPSDDPAKAAYIRPETENDKQKLIDFGVQKYTPKTGDDLTPYFIVKTSRKIMIHYTQDRERKDSLQGTIYTEGKGSEKTKNFSTTEPVFINLLKGNKLGNDFIRLQAILLDHESILQMSAPKDPFASLFDFEEVEE